MLLAFYSDWHWASEKGCWKVEGWLEIYLGSTLAMSMALRWELGMASEMVL